MHRNFKFIGFVSIALLLAFSAPARAQSPASFFKGKDLTIHIGSPPGGSVDLTARTVALSLGKYTGTNIIATNGPLGGQGRGTFNYIVKKAKPNGLSFGWHIGAAAAVYQMYGVGVEYDLRAMTWIGIIAPTRNSLIVNAKKYPTLDALRKAKQFFLAGGAKQSVDSQQGMVALEALGVPYRLVTGYQGTGPIRTAILRGEVDGMVRDYAGSEGEISAGNLAALIHLGPDRDPRLPKVPTILELGQVKEPFKTLLEATAKAGYFLVGHPGIPADRVQFLRAALKKVVEDPEFINRATKA
ncbi:MAG TPA: tripartite tricarboxylate transporter substrate-binding protein, partial [Candidatus Binatia bacterium]